MISLTLRLDSFDFQINRKANRLPVIHASKHTWEYEITRVC